MLVCRSTVLFGFTARLSSFLLLVTAVAWGANPPQFTLTLEQAQSRAEETSPNLKASQATYQASQDQSQSARSGLFPRLTLDGSYSYLTNVPTLTIGPFGNLQFGTHSNYNVGPTLSYTLFDYGQTRQNWHSLESVASARREDWLASRGQLELSLRLAYFRVQRALRDLLLTANSLTLAQAQQQDISNRFHAGSSSRLDLISAQREVENYQLRFRQNQSDVGAYLRELMALTGDTSAYDTSRPIPTELANGVPPGVDSPTLQVRLDGLEATLGKFTAKSNSPPGPDHPQVKSLALAAEASRMASDSEMAGLWPKIGVSARAALIYPDVVVAESAEQNTFMVTLSMPLFEADLSRSAASQRLRESMASDFLKEQRLTDINRDWHKAQDHLASLKAQNEVNDRSIAEAEEIAHLTYSAYRAGKVNYLDVQSANVRSLEAKVTGSQIHENMLQELANLAFLSTHSDR
jgi:outer membrane protein TolC